MTRSTQQGLYPQSAITLLVRTDRDPLSLFVEIHRRIGDIDKDAFAFDVKPMTKLIAESLAPRRFSTILLSGFAVIDLILSLTGIYEVIADAVAQRSDAVRRPSAGSFSVGHRFRLHARCGMPRKLPACSPREQSRPDHRATDAVIIRPTD